MNYEHIDLARPTFAESSCVARLRFKPHFSCRFQYVFQSVLPARKAALKERDAHDAALEYTRSVKAQEWPHVQKGDVLLQIKSNEFQRTFPK